MIKKRLGRPPSNGIEKKGKQLCIRMHTEEFDAFSALCYERREPMAEVAYNLIKEHLKKSHQKIEKLRTK